jgi:polysaccharide biosynthesis/export protein
MRVFQLLSDYRAGLIAPRRPRVCPTILMLAAVSLAAQTPGFSERDPHYRLQSEDKVEVQYRYTPEYNAIVSLQPDGYVSLPLVGEVALRGLTLAEAGETIRKKAGERLNEPEITVLLKDYIKPYFVVAGEVAKPGRVELRGDVKLIEAIALGGGFVNSAKRSQVILLRQSSKDMAEVRVFDLRKVMSQGGIREDVEIRSGDIVVVPRNAVSKVEPYVRISEAGLYALALRLL